jgi:hypothetical protein
MVKPEDAPKKLVWSEARVIGGSNVVLILPQPKARDGFYRDLCVLAYPINSNLPALRKPLQNLQQKALIRALEPFSAPVSTPLFEEYPAVAGEEDARVGDVIELSAKI